MTVTTFKLRQQYEVSKAMTVARIAMSTTLMPVTVDTFETRRRHIGPKVTTVTKEGSFPASKTMTVTRMATPRVSIPVTVDTFEASGGGRGWGWDTRGGGGNAERRRI